MEMRGEEFSPLLIRKMLPQILGPFPPPRKCARGRPAEAVLHSISPALYDNTFFSRHSKQSSDGPLGHKSHDLHTPSHLNASVHRPAVDFDDQKQDEHQTNTSPETLSLKLPPN